MGTFSKPLDDARMGTKASREGDESRRATANLDHLDRHVRVQIGTCERVASELQQQRGRLTYAAITANNTRLDGCGE